jgi:glucose/arabinose dehydrogenase
VAVDRASRATASSTSITRSTRRVRASIAFQGTTLSTGNVASGQTVLIDNIPSTAGNHNAGDVQFGKDSYLYVSVGDGGCDYANNSGCAGSNDASRDEHSLVGKILRITRDGTIPPDNPSQAPAPPTAVPRAGRPRGIGAARRSRAGCATRFASRLIPTP